MKSNHPVGISCRRDGDCSRTKFVVKIALSLFSEEKIFINSESLKECISECSKNAKFDRMTIPKRELSNLLNSVL